MSRLTLILIICLSAIASSAKSLTFDGYAHSVVTVTPPSSTGLDELYVIYDTDGVVASYTSRTSNPVKWYRYSNLGGGFAEEITDVIDDGRQHSVKLRSGDTGFIIEEGTSRSYFYVIDYAAHPFDVKSIRPSAEQDCGQVALDVEGNAAAITYYSINGRPMELDREITLSYETMIFDEGAMVYRVDQKDVNFSHLNLVIHAPAPLCATAFYLTGDRFLRAWGMEEEITSETMQPMAVEAFTRATQTSRENDNEKNPQGDGLGGSAPAEIEFFAAVTEGAVFTEWQFSTYPDFDDIQLRISDPVTTYTFRDQGVTYVRFVCANDAGTCDYYGPVYDVSIGASSLLCPNAFSPGASEGVNDEWKVSYCSIVSFECHIFNRLGVQMAEFSDPAMGWDGKYNGKLVPAGVYYYVIRARGADGKDYNLAGDINIVNYK